MPQFGLFPESFSNQLELGAAGKSPSVEPNSAAEGLDDLQKPLEDHKQLLPCSSLLVRCPEKLFELGHVQPFL